MKLLLTSTGLKNKKIKEQFLQLLNKEISEVKVIFIPTASRYEEELQFVTISKNELLDLGILAENILTLSLEEKVNYSDLADFDVIYVCGGNTFYLLKKVRESDFDKVMNEFAKADKLYVGASAGNILPGPNIDIASPFDENDVGLTDLKGLCLTDIVASPHYEDKDVGIIEPFTRKFKVVPLTDDQALFIDGEKVEVINN